MNFMLAVPTRGLVSHHTVTALNNELRGQTIHFEQDQLSVARCRNTIVKKFLKTPSEWLVMVDDDVVPPVGFLGTLLADHEADVRGWPYPTWNEPYGFHLAAYNFDVHPNNGFRPVELSQGWNGVDIVGTGCIAIHRHVLESMPNPFLTFRFEDNYSEDVVFAKDLWNDRRFVAAYTDGRICDHVRSLGLALPYMAQQKP